MAERKKRKAKPPEAPAPGESTGVEDGPAPGTSLAEVHDVRTPLEGMVEAAALAVDGAHMKAPMFRAIARTTAAKHIDFLDRVIAGKEMDVYQTMVGPVVGPPRLAVRIKAYEALTKGPVLADDAKVGALRARRAVLIVPVEQEEG